RRSCGRPGDGGWGVTGASFVGYEGLDDLVDAVILARSQGADLRLLIAGDGVALRELRERAAVLGENAVFTGRVSQAQAIEYQLALDAIVRSEEHTSELQSRFDLVCRHLLEKNKAVTQYYIEG